MKNEALLLQQSAVGSVPTTNQENLIEARRQPTQTQAPSKSKTGRQVHVSKMGFNLRVPRIMKRQKSQSQKPPSTAGIASPSVGPRGVTVGDSESPAAGSSSAVPAIAEETRTSPELTPPTEDALVSKPADRAEDIITTSPLMDETMMTITSPLADDKSTPSSLGDESATGPLTVEIPPKPADDSSNVPPKPPAVMSPSAAHRQRKSLWDEAYESLRATHPRIVDEYELFLRLTVAGSTRSWRRPSFDGSPDPLALGDLELRRDRMAQLHDNWLRDQHGSGTESSVHLAEIIKEAVAKTPSEAILAWVAVSHAASMVLLNPNETNEDDCQAAIYIVSRMEWYCRLPKLLDGEPGADNNNASEAAVEIERRIVSLYSAILLYPMGLLSPELLPFRSGSSGLQAIQDAESNLAVFNNDRVQDPLNKLLNASKIKRQESSSDKTGPGLPPGDAKLLDCLNVLDPRDRMRPVETDSKHPARLLYQALSSTDEFERFQEWGAGPETQLLWVCGDHGQGKTMVLTGAVYGLQPPALQHLAFFFFDHARPAMNNAATALKTILWQILLDQPDLRRHMAEKFDSTGRSHFNNPGDFLALSAVFYKIIEDDSLKRTYIVLDALDDCLSEDGQPGVGDFLNLITRSLKKCHKIKWVVSTDLSERFESEFIKIGCLKVDLGRGLPGAEAAIRNCIASKVTELSKAKNYDKELEGEITSLLHKGSRGNYLWVNIVCEALRSEQTWHATGLVSNASETSIPRLYDRLVDRFGAYLPFHDKALCTKVMSTMALVHDTLHINELDFLVDLGKWVNLTDILNKCSPFLTLATDGRVSFLHKAAKTYAQERVLDHATKPQQYSLLTQKCLEYLGLSLETKRTLSSSRLTDEHTSGSASTPNKNSTYSMLNWITHLSEIKDINDHPKMKEDVLQKVDWFLENHLIAWVEELVRNDLLAKAAVKLQALDLSLCKHQVIDAKQETTTDPLIAAIRDSWRFLRLHQLAESPDGVSVHNTVLFCPTESIIQSMWRERAFPWLQTSPTGNRKWGYNFAILRGHSDWVRCVAISPDGRYIASGSDDSTVRVWDATTGMTQHRFRVGGLWFLSVAISSRGLVAAGSDGFDVNLWDIATGREVKRLPMLSSDVRSVCFSDDGSKLAAGNSWKIKIWDLGREEPFGAGEYVSYQIQQNDGPLDGTCLAFGGAGGSLLASFKTEGQIVVWDLSSVWAGNAADRWGEAAQSVTLASDNGQDEATAKGEEAAKPGDDTDETDSSSETGSDQSLSTSKTIKLDLKPRHIHRIYANFSGTIWSIAFSPDSRFIACGSIDGNIMILEQGAATEGAEPAHVFTTPFEQEDTVHFVVFAANSGYAGGYVVASCTPRVFRFWDVETGRCLRTIRSPSTQLRGLAIAPGGDYAVTGAYDNNVRLWSAPGRGDEPEPADRWEHGKPIDISLGPDGRTLAVGAMGGCVSLWDIENAELVNPRLGRRHDMDVLSVSFSPSDGNMLASSDKTGNVHVSDVKTGELLYRFENAVDWARFCTWSPAGDQVASTCDDGVIRIWRLSNGEEQKPHILEHGDGYARGVAFSPDGEHVATCGNDGTIGIWARKTKDSGGGWERKKTLEGHGDSVLCVLVSADSKRIISSGSDRTIRIWDIDTGAQLNEAAPVVTGQEVAKMWLDERFPNHVLTPYGAIALGPVSGEEGAKTTNATTESAVPSRYRIVENEDGQVEWIMWGDKKVVFIPKEFRFSAFGIFGNAIVFCASSGQPHVYRYSEHVTPDPITADTE